MRKLEREREGKIGIQGNIERRRRNRKRHRESIRFTEIEGAKERQRHRHT